MKIVKSSMLVALFLILDIAIFIFLSLMMMAYEDFYKEADGEWYSLESMKNSQKIWHFTFIGWKIINLIVLVFLLFKGLQWSSLQLNKKREATRLSKLPVAKGFTKEGFLYSLEEENFIEWIKIQRIVGYKVDLLTIDEIRIDIEINDKFFTISEDCKGWDSLLKSLNEYLQLSKPDWLKEISKKPFEELEIVVYERKD